MFPRGSVWSARGVATCSGLSRLPPSAPPTPCLSLHCPCIFCWSSSFSLHRHWQYWSFSQWSFTLLLTLPYQWSRATLNVSSITSTPADCCTSSCAWCRSSLTSPCWLQLRVDQSVLAGRPRPPTVVQEPTRRTERHHRPKYGQQPPRVPAAGGPIGPATWGHGLLQVTNYEYIIYRWPFNMSTRCMAQHRECIGTRQLSGLLIATTTCNWMTYGSYITSTWYIYTQHHEYVIHVDSSHGPCRLTIVRIFNGPCRLVITNTWSM